MFIKISVFITAILSLVCLAQADSSKIGKSFDAYEIRKLIEKSEPIFECSLPPEKYSFYRLSEDYEDCSAIFLKCIIILPSSRLMFGKQKVLASVVSNTGF